MINNRTNQEEVVYLSSLQHIACAWDQASRLDVRLVHFDHFSGLRVFQDALLMVESVRVQGVCTHLNVSMGGCVRVWMSIGVVE